jgi:hypothetical protein
MSRRDLRLLLALLALCALAVALLISRNVAGLGMGFLFLMPALVMALPLLAGRYVGAERLGRGSSSRPPRRARIPAAGPVQGPFRLTPPRGGLLIAASLAVRPPPSVLSVH